MSFPAMSFHFPSDIQQSISAYIANGIYQNEEEVVREAIGLLNQRQEDLASIQRGLDDIAKGRFRSAEESNEEFRRIHNIPSVPLFCLSWTLSIPLLDKLLKLLGSRTAGTPNHDSDAFAFGIMR